MAGAGLFRLGCFEAGGGGPPVWAGPTLVSATGYPGPGGVNNWTPFTGLDISNCDMAVFIGSGDGTRSFTSASWTLLQHYVVADQMTTVLYKVAPTNSETLNIAYSGVEEYTGILLRINDASNISGTFANFGAAVNQDPPSHDAGAVRDHLWIAGGTWDASLGVSRATAAPSAYGNFTNQATAGTSGASTAIATRELTAQTEDPGAFTSLNESANTFTLALW